jgi:periplasmic divalent cation tolerance protein
MQKKCFFTTLMPIVSICLQKKCFVNLRHHIKLRNMDNHSENKFQILLAYVTFPDADSAKKVIQTLINERLIACGNVVSAKSFFLWQEKINDENETIAFLKTRHENALLLEKRLLELHPYDIPCVIRTMVDCNEKYFEWVNQLCL